MKQVLQKYKSHEGINKLSERISHKIEIEKIPAEACVFIGHYMKEGKNIHFIVNVEPNDIEIMIKTYQSNNVTIYSPFDGLISHINLPAKVLIMGYGGVFIVE